MINSNDTGSNAAKGLESEIRPSHDYVEFLNDQQSSPFKNHIFLTADEKMIQIKEIIKQIANANVSVLITGEPGVGKEVIAKEIHKNSSRANMPFITFNCSSIPQAHLEAEVFGVAGDNMQGIEETPSKFELAEGGTLVLEGITDFDANQQLKLLRALQDQEIQKLGGKSPTKINTRIIAISNSNIAQAVANGKFRQDLYYRLHVIPLQIPPLRERPKDIELIANYFIDKFSKDYRKSKLTISEDGLEKLQNYSWPGNIRELQNIMQRSVLMTTDSVVKEANIPIDLNSSVKNDDWISNLPIGTSLRELETHFILETLKSHDGNRTHAARTLGISLRTLRNKINEYTAAGYSVIGPGGKVA